MLEAKSSLINKEKIAAGLFLFLGIVNIGFVLVICIYLVITGLPGIIKIGLWDFILGTQWASTASEPKFGILPFILTSVYGTAGAIFIGLPIGLFTAVYLARFASKKTFNILVPMIDLLAGIPSVVYGFIGMLILVPAIQNIFNLPDGSGLLASIIVLSVMILPSIIKVSINAILSVQEDYELGSLALGANEIETAFKVIVPAARSGIAAAVVLGVGRALGEAMAVMMVAGNVSNMPSIFESVRFLTTAVASEMSYSSGLQREALFSIALVLVFFIMMINAVLNLYFKGKRK